LDILPASPCRARRTLLSRLLALALMGLVCLALLDRIPDPPTVLQKKTLDIARASHAWRVRLVVSPGIFPRGWSTEPVSRVSAAAGVAAQDIADAAFVRLAGDSSPPVSVLV